MSDATGFGSGGTGRVQTVSAGCSARELAVVLTCDIRSLLQMTIPVLAGQFYQTFSSTRLVHLDSTDMVFYELTNLIVAAESQRQLYPMCDHQPIMGRPSQVAGRVSHFFLTTIGLLAL